MKTALLFVCMASIGAFRPSDVIKEGDLPPDRIESLLAAGLIQAAPDDEPSQKNQSSDAMTSADFVGKAGLVVLANWDAVLAQVGIGQAAIAELAELKAALDSDPKNPAMPTELQGMTSAELKAALDAKGVTYNARDSKADLIALLTA